MASPQSTLPNDEKEAQDSAHNPGEKAYRKGMGSSSVNAGLDQLEAHANDPANHGNGSSRSVRDGEEKGNTPPSGGWDNNTTGNQASNQPRMKRFLGFAKKRGAMITIVGLLGGGGVLAGGFLGPSSMLISLMSNITSSNDSSSTALERRFLKVFGNSIAPDVVCGSVKVKCKAGKISNGALRKLEKKGITPVFEDKKTSIKKGGYPSKNPTSYKFDLGNGLKSPTVRAADLPGFLAKKENAKLASKLLGTKGAFNLKVKAWSGKHISKGLFNKFSITKKGGLADGSNKSGKYADALKNLRKKLPGLKNLDNLKANLNKKVDKHLGKAKKGGTGYLVSVAGCVAVKAPAYIAAGVAAVQLAQIMPLIVDVVLSPGSKLKASGVDPAASDFSGDDMSAIGSLLTNKTARESDGKMTSALDSPYLQSAIGVNTNKLPVPTDYVPGYSILMSPLVIASQKASNATAPACNQIMSPAAMYTAMSVDAAVTVAASSTVILGVAKFVASFALSELASNVVKNLVADNAVAIATDLATNDLVAQAEGEDLGTVLGLSGSAFFSAGGMARHLPTLQTGQQLEEFAALQQESADFEREMDIASLSPFDTSSKYTFLGSIVHNMQTATMTSGSYSGGIVAMLSNAAQAPLRNLSLLPSASATSGFSNESCGYAADFGLDTPEDRENPAINMAGLPCTGLTAQQASMTTDEAIDLIAQERWLDDSKDIADGATIADLVDSGYIIADTPLSNYIEDCSDASTGDYLFNSAGCIIDTQTKDPNAITSEVIGATDSCSVGECLVDSPDFSKASGPLDNGNAMAAIPVFLVDYQALQIINGEDDFNKDEDISAFQFDENESLNTAFYDQSVVEQETESVFTQVLKQPTFSQMPSVSTASLLSTQSDSTIYTQARVFNWRLLPVIG